MAATLTSKGQITIPKAVRDRLNLRSGDRVDFVVEQDGTVRMVPLTASVRELKALVPRPKRKLSLDDMDEAIARGAAKR
jgi:AbrB family looped-hinge helix DNA binding protein